ncbi:MAG TPA: transcription termination factor Rho [Acidimicrobiales bacterium]|nr:transcription termination factor Rho [Acidimicrobiales bacterium]
MEPQALERSALERKDRGELMTIATALGGKPGSRAKKADIVNLILELTGVATSSSDAAATPATAPPAEPPVADPAAEGLTARPRGQEGGDQEDRTQQDRTQQDRTQQSGGRQDRGQQERGQQDRSQQSGRTATDQQDRDRPDRGRQDRGQQDRGQQGRTQDRDQPRRNGDDGEPTQPADRPVRDEQGSNGNGADQRHDADGGDDGPEPGNRRRRRRGRDRARDDDQQVNDEPVEIAGLLDLRDEGYGFLRVKGYLPSKDDVYVSVKQVRQFSLRKGDHVAGASRLAARNEKNPALLRIDAVNGADPETATARPRFEDLTPLFPDSKLRMEVAGDPYNMTARIIDLIAPIGKGQRGLIVSPPKAGKTSVMKQIVRSIETNHPEAHLIVLLVDERPEEVTDMRRWVQKGEVAASTFDRPADEHTHVAELTIERAKRLVEGGRDVVIMLDGITRLARAYNLSAPPTGRIMSGGVDSGALYPPKKFFGAARNVEEGGSLTILATALVETGSRMDEVIFEEFKGTGNMELKLDRRMAERRVYPAIDVDASSTRHEELLFDRKQLQQVFKLRRVLSGLAHDSGHPGAGLELLIDRMKTFRDNDSFLAEIAKAPSGG